MTTVRIWSGREVRALRDAKRMSLREFAAHLGVSDRMVSKWEAKGDAIHPRPVNQAALDTSLATSTADERARFELFRESKARTVLIDEPGHEATGHHRPAHDTWVRHAVDGKAMTLVPAGDFLSGVDGGSHWLPAFYIDVFPTTNADYGLFVSATNHRAPSHWVDGHCPDGLLDHPVVFVTWRDADAYARWARKSLPSAEQWERAACGSGAQIYPWGNAPTPAKCNVREGQVGGTTPRDRYHSGTSPDGVYDMCGNVWEWCASPTSLDRYELKGSAFTSSFVRAAPSMFNDAFADMQDDDTGFRCVASLDSIGVVDVQAS